jgi:kynurenine--oxoglutarate transaminase/cysteine-S-conjugate beta-lyase/glutamine--phenylpyruvate transaminase
MSDKQPDTITKHYQYSQRFEKVGDSNIWVEINNLSREHNAVDLAEGFANYISYEPLVKAVQEVSIEKNWKFYQYTRNAGHLRLVNAIAKLYTKHFKREIDPLTQVLITIGAYGSLHNAITSLLNKDDEVILFEPFFDCYEPMVLIAEGKCVYVPLRQASYCSEVDQTTRITSGDWCLDDNELEGAFTAKTKLLILNTPHNPLGKVFTQKELSRIAELCIKNNVICISDEVYEYITYDKPHIRIASLPGMWERTLTIGSAGKTFASTGIKVGWTIGPQELVKLCQVSNDIDINVCPTFFQEVVARCYEIEMDRLESAESYFEMLRSELRLKRDMLAESLAEAGLEPIVPDGAYYMAVDISKFAHGEKFSSCIHEFRDHKFVKHLIKEHNLALTPMTAFYGDDHKKMGENFVRFCFFKDDETLKKAVKIVKELKIHRTK